MTGTTTADEKLTWLMEGLLERTPGARHALVLSRDGLKLCRTPELSVDQADQLAAIAAGIQSLSHGASVEFGDGTGGVRSAMTEFYGGMLFIVEAGEGAHLAVVTDGGRGRRARRAQHERAGRAARRAPDARRRASVDEPGPAGTTRPDRLYTLTGGRSRSGPDNPFDLVTLVVAECDPVPGMQSEHAAILRLRRRPTAVVEIAAELRLPVSITKILLSDLLAAGRVSARHPRNGRRCPTPTSWSRCSLDSATSETPCVRDAHPAGRAADNGLKIVVVGGFGVGKTTMVRSVSEIRPLNTEETMTQAGEGVDDLNGVRGKTATTVAFDFGRITLDERNVLYLFGAPGQERFWFLWDRLFSGTLGAVVLVDTRRIDDSWYAIDRLERHGTPFIVACNDFGGPTFTPGSRSARRSTWTRTCRW